MGCRCSRSGTRSLSPYESRPSEAKRCASFGIATRESGLSKNRSQQLADLGSRITRSYNNLPQDIEWALADGQFYILQARPITGVEYSWDADLEYWQVTPDDPDTVWTRAMSDQWWTGAVTPLMYS